MHTEQTTIEHRSDTTDGLLDLEGRIDGAIFTPGDPDWDTVRQAWNLAVDQRPAAVVLPESADDVAVIVDFARQHALRVAPQGTGHNSRPLAELLDRTILVKTERMRGVEIDAPNRRARIEAGALWMDVTDPAGEHGLAALAGSSPDVGVVGYSLGGGISWLSRRHGLAANSVMAVELVTADGRQLRADRENHPDLFWALRGGGGSFGVVTAIEIELFPITHVYAGAMFWPVEHAREVLQTWRQWTQRELPDEIISVGRTLNLPPFPEVPEPLRGRSFVVVEVVYRGHEAAGCELIDCFRMLRPEIDTVAMIPVPALGHLHMDPEHPVPGRGDGLLVDDLPIEAIDAVVETATGDSGSALLSVELRQLGGAIARSAPEHGALSSIEAPYIMFAVGMAPTPEAEELVGAQVDAVKRSLSPWAADYAYMNFAERPVDGRMLYAQDYTHRRLQAIKATYDPQDMIQSNHPIRPAR